MRQNLFLRPSSPEFRLCGLGTRFLARGWSRCCLDRITSTLLRDREEAGTPPGDREAGGRPLFRARDVAPFLGALETVVFAAASDNARPVLTAVYVMLQEDGLALVAGDGYRLAECSFPVFGNVWAPGITRCLFPLVASS